MDLDSKSLMAGSVLLALLSHAIFKRLEPTPSAFALCLVTIQLALVSSWYALPSLKGEPLLSLVIRCNLLYLGTLASSIATYRLFFHPLSKYPGPLLGRLSKFYLSWIALNGDTRLQVEEMHRKYGDIVRYGPNELSFINPDDVAFIQGGLANKIRRGPSYDGIPEKTRGETLYLASTRNVEAHRFRRRIWEKAFTTDALTAYEPIVVELIGQVVEQCTKKAGSPVDIGGAIDHFAFDVMGSLGFGRDFGMINDTNAQSREWMYSLGRYMRMLSIVRHVPWFRNCYRILPIDIQGKLGGLKFVTTCLQRFEERFNEGTGGNDIIHHLMQPESKSGQALTKYEIAEEALSLVVAGSDTTSVSLTYAFYHLLQEPEVYRKLQQEVDSLWDGHSPLAGTKLAPAQAPYVNGVINEALRVGEPDPNGNQRSTPKGGVMINQKYIPESTQMSIHKWSMQRDERNFTRAKDFIPERWISDEERLRVNITNHNAKGFIPFGAGTYGCIGKPLALSEMRLFLVGVLRRLEISPVKDYNFAQWSKGVIDNVILVTPPLPVMVKIRKF